MAFSINRFAKQVRKLDDALGQFADYEGDESGPTAYMFKLGKERWERRCETAASLHEEAARLWRRALAQSKREKP